MRLELPSKLEAARTQGHPEDGAYGCFDIFGPCAEKLFIVASAGNRPEDDVSEGWEHVSISTRRRCPNWLEMCFVKDLFWLQTECVIQYHMPEMHHINNHPFCLHLWRHPDQGFPTPPPVLVGIKGLDLDTAKVVMHQENKAMRRQGRRGISQVGLAAAMAMSALSMPGKKDE